MSPEEPRATLIYDGRCQLCRTSVEWIRARDTRRVFDFLPFQEADLEARFPQVSRAECERAVTLVLPGGAVLSGADALPSVLGELPRWRLLAPLLSWRLLRPLSRRLYDYISTRRLRDI
jgi:predicted DCC family thiol-disulfide oxidoreductase YuxK